LLKIPFLPYTDKKPIAIEILGKKNGMYVVIPSKLESRPLLLA
jgi:hypothetical protein